MVKWAFAGLLHFFYSASLRAKIFEISLNFFEFFFKIVAILINFLLNLMKFCLNFVMFVTDIIKIFGIFRHLGEIFLGEFEFFLCEAGNFWFWKFGKFWEFCGEIWGFVILRLLKKAEVSTICKKRPQSVIARRQSRRSNPYFEKLLS